MISSIGFNNIDIFIIRASAFIIFVSTLDNFQFFKNYKVLQIDQKEKEESECHFSRTMLLVCNIVEKPSMLAVLRRSVKSVKRVCGSHLHAIAPAGNTARFEEMSQRWRTVSSILSNLTGLGIEP